MNAKLCLTTRPYGGPIAFDGWQPALTFPPGGATSTLEIVDENVRLTALLPGDPPEALTPLGQHRFVGVARPDKHLTFVVRKGRAVSATYESPEGTYEGGERRR